MVKKNQYVSITKDIIFDHPQHSTGSQMNSTSQSASSSVDIKKNKKKDLDNSPPYSRLFIICDKDTTEEEIVNVFESYGNIEYCRMLKEKKTADSKGICYLKFDKTSSAAKALEELNGVVVTGNGSPIKIQIAEPKNAKKKIYSKDPEDTPPRSRLFVVCPKEMSEETLNERFKDFEDLEYCKVITDKTNGDSKGFAYVKFSKASSAAIAMEEILQTGLIAGMKIKILISDPKEKRFEHSDNYSQTMYMLPYHPHPELSYAPPYPLSNRLEIISSRYIPESDLNDLLQRYPGFEFNHFLSTNDEPHVAVKLHSEFSSYEAASFAQYHLHGSEFPPGNFLHCAFVYTGEFPNPVYPNLYYPPHPVYPSPYADLTYHPSYYPQDIVGADNASHTTHSSSHGSSHGGSHGGSHASSHSTSFRKRGDSSGPFMIPNYAWPSWGYSTSPPSDYRF